MAHALGGEGYLVRCEAGVFDAQAALDTFRPDLAIVDVASHRARTTWPSPVTSAPSTTSRSSS